jgi:hypothetical protein
VRLRRGAEERFVKLKDSAQHLIFWLNQHPRGWDENAPLWITSKGTHIHEDYLKHLLKQLAKRAEVENVNPSRFTARNVSSLHSIGIRGVKSAPAVECASNKPAVRRKEDSRTRLVKCGVCCTVNSDDAERCMRCGRSLVRS